MAGKTPLSRVSSPADFSANFSRNTRRHPPRISSNPSHESELNSFDKTQSPSSSLPSTPLTSSFDDTLHSTKRRKTQLNGSKPLLPKGDKAAMIQPSDLPKSRESARKPVKTHPSNRNTPETDKVFAADRTVTRQTPNEVSKADGVSSKDAAGANTVEHWEHTLPNDNPQAGRAGSSRQKDDPKSPVRGPSLRTRRSSKKPLPGSVEDFARQLRHRSRNTAGEAPYNDIEAQRAASQPLPTLVPAAFDNDRPKSSQSVEVRDLKTDKQSWTAMSTPIFSLSSPRFSQLSKDDHEFDGNNTQESRTDVLDDNSSFDLNGDTARDNHVFDGHVERASSPAASSIIIAGIRTSGRTRKPTIRAMESIESQKRIRKVKQNASGETTKDNAADMKNESSSFSHSGSERKSDFQRVSERLFEAAVTALLPDFEKSVNGDSIIEEIRKDYVGKKMALDAQSAAQDNNNNNNNYETASNGTNKSLEGEGEKAEESRPSPPSKTLLLPNHPQSEKPWTDEDGWTHTGHTNIYGEEIAVIPENFEWYRPSSSYGAERLPVPPVRFKSRDQVQKDGIFGFPPPAGQRNVPRGMRAPFIPEDVEAERAKIRAREEVRKRGISVHPSMSLEELRGKVQDYDLRAAVDPSLKRFEPMSPVQSEAGIAERPRRRRRDNRSSYPTTGKEEYIEPRPRRRRDNNQGDLPSSPRKAENNNQPRPRRRRQKAHSLDAPIPESRAVSPNTKPSSPSKSKKRLSDHAEKEEYNEKKGEGTQDSEDLPRKRLRLVITRQGTGKEVTTDLNGEEVDDSTATTTSIASNHDAAPIVDAESVATPQSTAHGNEQDAGGTSGGRPKRRAAAAAASATNSQMGAKFRKNNSRRRKEAVSPQDEDKGEDEDGDQDVVTSK